MILLSGFLGAGKTTILQNLLENRQGLRLGVIVNDVGEVNIDGQLLAREVAGHHGVELVELQNGCICCTLADDMLTSVLELLTRRQSQGLDAIIVELSGVAEPKEVLQNWAMAKEFGHPAAMACRLQSIVTVLDVSALHQLWVRDDGTAAMAELASNVMGDPVAPGNVRLPLVALLAEQLEAAHMVLFSKTDLAEQRNLHAAEELVAMLNPAAQTMHAARGTLERPQALLEPPAVEVDAAFGDALHPYGGSVSAAKKYGIRTFTYTARRPFYGSTFADLLQALQEEFRENGYDQRQGLLRMKGVYWLAAEPAHQHRINFAGSNYSVKMVEPWFAVCDKNYLDMRIAHPVDRDAYRRVKSYAWDDTGWGDRRQELVCIGGQGMDASLLQKRLDACLLVDGDFEAFSDAYKDQVVALSAVFPGLA